jgi:hypothetical protein
MSNDESKPSSKVARLLEAYGIEEWGERLERRWTGADGERTSLRDLADEFNEAVLKAALDDAGISTTAPEISTTYRILVDDDVSRADRRRKERNLKQAGLDVDDIRSDFVTHQAIHTYLTSYRGTELPTQSTDSPAQAAENLQQLQGRTTAVAESTVDQLVSQGEVSDHEYQVLVDLRVVCEDCGSGYSIEDLIRRGGCGCDVR